MTPSPDAVVVVTTPSASAAHVVTDIVKECNRQDELRAAGRFDHTPNEVSVVYGFLMLSEEIGEMARELQDGWDARGNLYKETIQAAAIALRIAEGIRQRGEV